MKSIRGRLYRGGLALGVAFVSACGGGGSGTSAPPVDPPLAKSGISLVAGSFEVGTAGCGYVDGQGSAARFNAVTAIHATASGDVILVERPSLGMPCSEQSPARLRKVSASGAVSTFARGVPLVGSVEPWTSFANPLSVSSDADGTVFVADGFCKPCSVVVGSMLPYEYPVAEGRGRGIWQIRNGQVSILAGVAKGASIIDGMGQQAVFKNPTSVVVGSDGALLVRDEGTLRRVTRDGQVSSKPVPGLWHEIAVDKGGQLFGIVGIDLVNLSTGEKLFANIGPVDSMAVDSKGSIFLYSRQAGAFIRRWSPGQSSLQIVVGRIPDGAPNVVTLGDLPGRLVDVRAITVGPDDALYIALSTSLLKVKFD
jgi:hypothetical protein